MKQTILYGGSFRKANRGNETKSEINLDKWLHRILGTHNVPHTVPCCPCPASVPTRVTIDEDVILEHWDCTTAAWIPTVITNVAFTNITADTAIISDITASTVFPVTASNTVKIGSTLQTHGATVVKNVTAAVTAAELSKGYITSTSAAAVTLTMPTVANLVSQMNASAGDRFQFLVNNAGGANTVTIDLTGSGMSVNTPAITGGATLTVSVANAVAIFEIVFLNGTTAKILRIA